MKRVLLALLLIPFGCAPKPGSLSPTAAISAIDGGRTKKHVEVLASDDMEGRGLGTEGIKAAAEYIVAQFEDAGLEPAGPEGSWYQPFEMTVALKLGDDNELHTEIPATALKGMADPKKKATTTIDWTVGETWSPVGLSESGTVEGPVVFAGYGITAPKYDYDDFKGMDVKDKVVLMMRFEPGEDDPNSPFDGREYSHYSMLRYKAIRARELGAKAVLFVTPPMGHLDEPDELVGIEKDFTTKGSIISAHVKREIADRLLASSGLTLQDLQKKIEDTGKPQSAELNASVHIRVDVIPQQTPARNVVAMLEGSDAALKKQLVVVGAHYDHLGFGSQGTSLDPDRIGQVHNGADDNASGTAALIEIARALARSTPRPKRSVLFIAFSAEEAGLGGSSYYVKNPVIPLEQTVAMLNMDMVGRLRENKVHAFGAETAEEFASILKKANTEDLDINAHGDGYGPSDHTAFFSQNIPVLHFFTGAHPQYHKTTDDTDLINGDGLGQVARLVARTTRAIADTAKPPTFQRPRSNPHMANRHGPRTGGRGYGPYFGSIPDFTEREEPGVRLTGVREGSPAQTAGIQAGDVLVDFGGVEIKNLYDFTYALRQHKPGDTVEVTITREGTSKTFEVTLTKRGH